MWTPGVASRAFEHIVSSHQWTYLRDLRDHHTVNCCKVGMAISVLFYFLIRTVKQGVLPSCKELNITVDCSVTDVRGDSVLRKTSLCSGRAEQLQQLCSVAGSCAAHSHTVPLQRQHLSLGCLRTEPTAAT